MHPLRCVFLNIVNSAEKAKRCGTRITLQNLAGLHLGKLGSASKTSEVLNSVKIILTALYTRTWLRILSKH